MNQIAQNNYQRYINEESHPFFLNQVKTLTEEEKEACFADSLSFGTGGLRAKIGCGTNRLNPFTIALSSQGVANYAKNCFTSPLTAVISYDSRNFSRDFALEAARVFTANGIKIHLMQQLEPVPLLSFAVRYLKAHFGIMITASHNPAAYNGYKVYWQNGAQVINPHDQHIIEAISSVTDVHKLDEHQAHQTGLLHWLDTEIEQLYTQAISPVIRRPALIREQASSFPLVYSALHGSGGSVMAHLLKAYHFNFSLVSEQQQPDGNFPTVAIPNPEDQEALSLAVTQAEQKQARLVFATDPDADRLGVAVLHQNRFQALTGNQIGAILLDYIALTRKELQLMPGQAIFINTIVSSPMHKAIAHYYAIEHERVLTGFKFIAAKIEEQQQKGFQHLFSCEESYGYLVHDEVGDKDALGAALVLAECALWNHAQGRTLIDHMEELYQRFGYFTEHQESFTFDDTEGQKKIARLMEILRANKFQWGPWAITDYRDYLDEGQDLPLSDVLELVLENNLTLIARPSGTEPKIKFYLLAQGNNREQVEETIAAVTEQIRAFVTTS